MARIYRTTDRITIQIDDIKVKVSPLTYHQKSEIQHHLITGSTKGDIRELSQGVYLAIQYGLKDIQGLQDNEGNPYKLEIENGKLTDACIDDLMNTEFSDKLQIVCATLVNGIPKKIVDKFGKEVKGVKIVKNDNEGSTSKN